MAGELIDATLDAHLENCEICQERLAALRADNERIFLRPPTSQSQGRRPYLGTLIAAAAAILLYVGVGPGLDPQGVEQAKPPLAEPQDYFRIKGSLNVEFFVKRQEQVAKAKNGSTVYPGDKLGFRVSTPVSGHLMIAGIDGKNEPYLCYPQNGGGRSQSFGPSKKMKTLDQAIVLDDVLGQEEIVAVFCDDPVDYESLAKALRSIRVDGQAPFTLSDRGCRHRMIQLNKSPVEIE